MDYPEQRRQREKIIFYNMKIINKMKYFCLSSPRTMHHAVNFGAQ